MADTFQLSSDVRVISVELTALTDRFAYTVDADCILNAVGTTAAGVFISRDGSRSKSSLQTPTAQVIGHHWIASIAAVAGVYIIPPVQLKNGEIVYISTSAAACVLLYVEDLS